MVRVAHVIDEMVQCNLLNQFWYIVRYIFAVPPKDNILDYDYNIEVQHRVPKDIM
jgi:hypothetical protein